MKSQSKAMEINEHQSILPLDGQDDIKRIRGYLAEQPRNLLLFELAVGTGLMMKDLLQMKVTDIQKLTVGDKFSIAGGNRGNPIISENIYQAFQAYFQEANPKTDEYLFRSRKGNHPLNVSSVSDMIKQWFKTTDLNHLTGAKSLRKTWEAYYKDGSEDFETKGRNKKPAVGPLEPVTLQEMAYQELLKAIVSREIEPGQILVTDDLAREMRTSTRPVREALARLAQAGFVTPKKRRGFVVVELTEGNLIEIVKIRLPLETMAAEKAAECRSQETMDRLETIFQQLVKAESKEIPDLKELYKINRDFHLTIYEASKLPILLPMIIGLWDKWAPYNVLMLRKRFISLKARENNLIIHEGILKGMRKSDAKMVRKYLEQDLNWVIESLANKMYS
jgi:DNA-binding GntR family transcriptional regulator